MWKLLTSPVTGPLASGLSLLLGLALAWLLVSKNTEIADLKAQVRAETEANQVLRLDNATLRGNQVSLEGAVKQCNDGLSALKTTTDAVTQAGVRALQQVQQAGKSVDAKARAIDALPKETCEDAFKILKTN